MALKEIIEEHGTVIAGVVATCVGAYAIKKLFFSSGARGANPFATDARRAPQPLELDLKKRDKVLKQGYTKSAVPKELDAIVIGSGIGGMCTAALMARAGKRVLVVEQHDQIGGCCHTFHDKGYEFDVGIHYIGEMRHNTSLKFLLDQISEGQIQWVPLNDEFDRVALGSGKDIRYYPVLSGRGKLEAALKKQFPKDTEAIDKYMKLLHSVRPALRGFVMLKLMPSWMAQLLCKTGLVNWLTSYFTLANKTLTQVLDEITDNEELKAVLSYCFGDYGTLPSETSFVMHAALVAHFLYGVAYPRGGSSEIAFNIIPVIEKAGGRCLVRANVSEIVVDETGKKAIGVKIAKDGNIIKAPLVVSAAGVFNTFKLLPEETREVCPSIQKTLSHVRHGVSCLTAYIGLEGTAEELELSGTNIWAFKNGNNIDKDSRAFLDKSLEQVIRDRNVPLMFISFPSTKDPTWQERFPGKTTMEIVTLARWEWFEEWKDERVKKRGDDYKSIKDELGDILWEQALTYYPQLEDKRDYFDLGSPLSNNYYIASPKGEIYGVDHDIRRFTPEAAVRLRPETPVENLFITGQDVFNCGFAGALFGGMLGASAVLNRNLMVDLIVSKSQNPPRKYSA